MADSKDESFLKVLQDGESAKLLSIDGGGIKGISSLLILEAIMEEVKKIENDNSGVRDNNTRLPRNYFHLAAGTSTGGLIAIMLFRLGMSATAAIEAYEEFSRKVFKPGKVESCLEIFPLGTWMSDKWNKLRTLCGDDKYSAKPLEKVINEVISEYGLPNDKTTIANGDSPCLQNDKAGRMFVCATNPERGESVLFRTHKIPPDAHPVTQKVKDATFENIPIHTAAWATSAAPTYLPECVYKGVTFWDGGLLNNNPINQLWRARFDLVDCPVPSNHFGDNAAPAKHINDSGGSSKQADEQKHPAPKVSCILSLGCSWSDSKPGSIFRFRNTVTKVGALITNTESKHTDFKRYINRINGRQGYGNIEYIRCNVPTQNLTIRLDDWEKMNKLRGKTEEWIKGDGRNKIERCAKLLTLR